MKSLEVKGKSIEEAIEKALKELNVTREDVEVEVLENPTKGFLGFIGSKEGKVRVTVLEKEIKEVDVAKEFIHNILKNMNIEANVDIIEENNVIKVNISGEDASCLIGRRGETLDSIQFLAGLALNKVKKDSKSRVLIDIENYREKREESLRKYAHKVAREVAKTKKTKKLDYMNPYERRIVHSALQNDRFVKTYSEGEDPYRRLVIECKDNRKPPR